MTNCHEIRLNKEFYTFINTIVIVSFYEKLTSNKKTSVIK